MSSSIFAKKRICFEKLLPFGFVKSTNGYEFRESILNGDFEVRIQVTFDGKIASKVMDSELNEEYLALYVEHASGIFVGQVREAYLDVLERIASNCCQALPFSNDQANRLADWIASEWGDPVDYPFEKYPQYASYRVGGKWYALIFPLKLEKLGFSGAIAEQEVEVVNLKVEPTEIANLLSKDGIFPSYHMSKKSWVSVVLDDSLSDEELWELVTQSRSLAAPNLLGRSQGPNFWLIPANPKYYDIDAEFAENKIIDWTQKASIKKGDYVGIYITAPSRMLRYLCRVVEADMDSNGYRNHPDIKRLMRIELIRQFDDGKFPASVLKELGVSNIRGPRRMTKELIEKVEETLND
ncbi:MmcQ/YjbR family DNA-binding protein [Streptococcus caballi]|uniref:MmcQ/YjbR family DNA-binding protein n=1 Tax=Streptococcus caballi TaxID=439220 RepID=UPI0003764143|nr:MmcQ/YjbR family DNA-binding protein [Streptococcus caballi]